MQKENKKITCSNFGQGEQATQFRVQKFFLCFDYIKKYIFYQILKEKPKSRQAIRKGFENQVLTG